jgi:1,4-dihydroxy-2-naphthoyl-CoA synthase
MKIIDEKDMGTVKLLTHEGNFATILLNRPDVLNAMNPALIDDVYYGRASYINQATLDLAGIEVLRIDRRAGRQV